MKNSVWLLLIIYISLPAVAATAKKKVEKNDRKIWCDVMLRMVEPVLSNMSEGRLMAGLAPWLSLPDDDTAESVQRKQLREWALKSDAQAVVPKSTNYLLWRTENQTLVDAPLSWTSKKA